jgi:hypothetical protein
MNEPAPPPPPRAPTPAQLQTARAVAQLSELPPKLAAPVERAVAQLLAKNAVR